VFSLIIMLFHYIIVIYDFEQTFGTEIAVNKNELKRNIEILQ